MSEINNTSVLDNTSPDWPRVDDLVQIVKGYLRVDWTGTETPADKDARGRIIADPRLWPLYQLVRPHQEDPNYLAKLVRDHIPEPENQQKFVTAWKLAQARALAQLEARDAAKDATRAAAAAKAEAQAKAAKRAETEAEKARKEVEARAVAETLDQVPLTQTYHQTDLGNAERFVNKFGAVLRYCHPWKKWLYWDGRRWSYDRIGIVGHCAKDTVRAIATEEADLVGDEARGLLRIWARKSEDAKSLCSLVKLATSESSLPILPETLDADPWLLNCRNCTLDLRRGAPS